MKLTLPALTEVEGLQGVERIMAHNKITRSGRLGAFFKKRR
jgi:hypothetical protein